MPAFPPHPTIGQRITGPGGMLWAWDGIKWTHATADLPDPAVPQITRVQAGLGLTGGGITGDLTLALAVPVPVELGGTGAIDMDTAVENLGGPWLTSSGRTDGGDAAPGEIGEYKLQLLAANLTTLSGNMVTVGTFTLTAGDWDVWAEATFHTGDNSLQSCAAALVGVTQASPFNLTGSGFIAAPASNIVFAIPAARSLSATSRSITVNASWRFASPYAPSGGPQVQISVRARRMR